MEFIKHYLVVGGLFLVLDSLWLSLVANKFYKSQLGSMLRPKPNFTAAAIFYLVYMAAIVVFALDPALDKNSAWAAGGLGAFLGLAMYATYDLTNLATLKDWPLKLVAVDMLWGTIATAAVTKVAFYIFR